MNLIGKRVKIISQSHHWRNHSGRVESRKPAGRIHGVPGLEGCLYVVRLDNGCTAGIVSLEDIEVEGE